MTTVGKPWQKPGSFQFHFVSGTRRFDGIARGIPYAGPGTEIVIPAATDGPPIVVTVESFTWGPRIPPGPGSWEALVQFHDVQPVQADGIVAAMRYSGWRVTERGIDDDQDDVEAVRAPARVQPPPKRKAKPAAAAKGKGRL